MRKLELSCKVATTCTDASKDFFPIMGGKYYCVEYVDNSVVIDVCVGIRARVVMFPPKAAKQFP